MFDFTVWLHRMGKVAIKKRVISLSELIMQPEIKKCQDNDVAEMEGKRRIFLTWKVI